METQNQIKKTLKQPEAIKRIREILASSNLNRKELADKVCELFGFFDPNGHKQQGGCMKALRELEKKGKFVLPKPLHIPGKNQPRRLGKPVPEPIEVPGEVEKIRDLRMILVETDEHRRIWNELMIVDHPQGAGPLVGRQIRYLVESEHGWLGGFGFSSAALHLEDRDTWIGWDWKMRQTHLHHVVNMSRFLIRSSVSCKNLASKLLGMVIQKFPEDFQYRYNYRPLLLESFVDVEHFNGTCYRAANWQRIGQTKGRGRQDRDKKQAKSVKDIYVWPLAKDFRTQMGLHQNDGLDALSVADSPDGKAWAKKEFGDAPLGDKRLSDRLVEVALDKVENPGQAYSNVAKGNWPKVKSYYRLIDHPDDSAVTMSNILLPHRKQTIRRMKAEKTVLCIQDGSDLCYTHLAKCKGLGIIGKNQTGAQSKGLHLHSTLAINTDGIPLGVLRGECLAPEPRSKEDKRSTETIPIEEKKTFSWLKGMRDCQELKAQMPHTSLVNIMDREADFFELFDDQRLHCSNIHLIVRAHHDRGTTGEHKLFETARLSPIQTRLKIKVPRQSARPKKSKQKARPKRIERIADVAIRYTKIELKPPSNCREKEVIPLWVVHVKEDHAPAGVEPIEWFLLTTLEIKSIKDAQNCVKWYSLRWRIEDWHRVLKSGCGVEKLAHETADRLRRAIAINMVIAWRIMLMTLLGRIAPELPAEVLFSPLEIKVLKAYAQKKTLSPQIASVPQ
ncbi:MAG: hypothetical protein ACD_28C00352G0001 [uncultured bacterium]|nr:MAG: hypothetical protein ACD_28C00352G0001 [uncultured bacterium]